MDNGNDCERCPVVIVFGIRCADDSATHGDDLLDCDWVATSAAMLAAVLGVEVVKTFPYRPVMHCRAKVEEKLGRAISLFSFPNGEFNAALLQAAREAGYSRTYSTLPIPACQRPHEFLTGRMWAEPDDWNIEVHMKIVGAYRWQHYVTLVKRRLWGHG